MTTFAKKLLAHDLLAISIFTTFQIHKYIEFQYVLLKAFVGAILTISLSGIPPILLTQ